MGRSPCASLFVAMLVAGTAHAQPIDLSDATPRWVAVAFEVLPEDKPAQFDTLYTRKILAWLAPHTTRGQVRVTVPRQDVERDLLALHNPVPGSFSDFVWVFDPLTGEVVSAELTGRLVKRLDWGLFKSEVEAEIRVDMGTNSAAAFHEPRRWLGQKLFRSCSLPAGRGCTVVEPASYDARTGYVNAVGELSVRFRGITIRTFSPLGEALFSELSRGMELSSLISAEL